MTHGPVSPCYAARTGVIPDRIPTLDEGGGLCEYGHGDRILARPACVEISPADEGLAATVEHELEASLVGARRGSVHVAAHVGIPTSAAGRESDHPVWRHRNEWKSLPERGLPLERVQRRILGDARGPQLGAEQQLVDRHRLQLRAFREDRAVE